MNLEFLRALTTITMFLWIVPALIQLKSKSVMKDFFIILAIANIVGVVFLNLKINILNSVYHLAFIMIMIFFTRFMIMGLKRPIFITFGALLFSGHVITFYMYKMYHFDSVYFILINMAIIYQVNNAAKMYLLRNLKDKFYFYAIGVFCMWNIVQKVMVGFGYYDTYVVALFFDIFIIGYFSFVTFEDSNETINLNTIVSEN